MILGTRDTERPTIGLEALPTFESLQSDIRWFLRLIDSLVGFWSLVRTFGLKRAFFRHIPILKLNTQTAVKSSSHCGQLQ